MIHRDRTGRAIAVLFAYLMLILPVCSHGSNYTDTQFGESGNFAGLVISEVLPEDPNKEDDDDLFITFSGPDAPVKIPLLPGYPKLIPQGIDLSSFDDPPPATANCGDFADSSEVRKVSCGEDAVGCRLWFERSDGKKGEVLPSGFWITLESLDGNFIQTFDNDSLAEWGDASAFFNGKAINVTICRTANAKARWKDKDFGEYLWRRAEFYSSDVSILGNIRTQRAPNLNATVTAACRKEDKRKPHGPPKYSVARLFPQGGTATVAKHMEKTVLLTAGHNITPRMQLVQINVPASDKKRNARHPPPEDQFPVKSDSVVCGLDRERQYGNDWVVFEVGRNARGESLKERIGETKFGELIAVPGRSTAAPCHSDTEAGCAISVIGYGLDDRVDSSSKAWTLQESTCKGLEDPCRAFGVHSHEREGSRYFFHTAATAPGSSGSPIIGPGGRFLGIHTDGLCVSGKPRGVGVSFANEVFYKAARGELADDELLLLRKQCKDLFDPNVHERLFRD